MLYSSLVAIIGVVALLFWFYLCYMLIRDDLRNEKERKMKQGKTHDHH